MTARSRLAQTVVLALRRAGREMLTRFGRAKVSAKGRGNLVTEADHACERTILRTIRERHPGHGFLSEERPPRPSSSGALWVIDPLDGTTNYAHSFPVACVSVAAVQDGVPLAGGVYDPFRDELFLAEKGRGTTLNGRPVTVARPRGLAESLLITGFAYDRIPRSRFYTEFYRAFMTLCHDVRRSGSASLDMAWVAAGRADAFWEFNLNPWDVGAGLLLVEEAGGLVTDFAGRPWGPLWRFGIQTLAASPRVHREMIRVFRRPSLWRLPGALPRDHGSLDPRPYSTAYKALLKTL